MDADAIALFRVLADRPHDAREDFYASHGIPATVCAEVESLFRFDRSTDNSFRACVAEAVDQALRGAQGAGAAAPPAVSLAGEVLGSYTLTSPIGQGGMGSVWLARRSDGRFEGVAAVKLLNAPLVGHGLEEQFRREGNVLARLQHPHIAHLIDAGVAASGQPYLVLEHVEGDQIDRWCDGHRLDIDARIRIFLDVLSAVAHAHGHLIVHRDIKPSNILVSHDGRVKLLDFGIAKLLEHDGGAVTSLTHEGSWALTPAYASPEQLTGGAVTTATDVYSLGVVLYSLLCGRHPYAAAGQSRTDLFTAIAHGDPPRMSDAAFDREQTTEDHTRAVNRAMTAEKLRRALRGDLDTIVAKALKRNPLERYSSVTAFADDLRRYLADQPIGAVPDTLAYRSVKFVRRNRIAVAMGSLAVLAMAGGLAGTLTQARRATQQAALAIDQRQRAEAVSDFLVNVFKEAEPAIPGAPPRSVLELVKDAVREARANRGMNALARTELLGQLGVVIGSQGDVATSQSVLEETFRDAERRLGPDAELTLQVGAGYAEALILAGAQDRARTLLDTLLARTPRHLSAARAKLLTWSSDLHAQRLDDEDLAVGQAQEAIRLCQDACTHTDRANALISLADAQNLFNRAAESAATWEQVVALNRERYGPSHLNVANALQGLSRPLRRLGQLDRAEAALREALDIADAVLDPDDHRRSLYLNALSNLLWVKRDYPGALTAGREGLRISRAALGDDHPELGTDQNNVGMFMAATGDYQGAVDVLQKALRLRERYLGPDNRRTAVTRGNFGDTLARGGDLKGGIAELRHAIASLAQSAGGSEDHFVALEKLARVHLDSGDGQAAVARYDAIAQLAQGPPEHTKWLARAGLGRGRALVALGRLTEARRTLESASRIAVQSPLDTEPALELQLARALVDCRLEPGPQSQARAADSLTAMTAMKFPPLRLRALAEQVQKAAAPGAAPCART